MGKLAIERMNRRRYIYLACVMGVAALLFCVIANSKTNNHSVRRVTVSEPSSSQQSSSYALATKESYGFFTDITDETWRMYQQRARNEPIYSSNGNNPPIINDAAQSAEWLLFNVDPIFTCPHIRRVGGRGDGPKWTCDPHRLLDKQQDCLIYSVGSQGVYLFEDSLIETLQGSTHCEIHVFDPDPKYERINDRAEKNIHYHPWGLRAESEADPGLTKGGYFEGKQFFSFPQIMKRLGHTGRRIDILKIDCEYCEVTAYEDFVSDTVDIRQILIETHFGLETNVTSFFDRFLDHGYVPFSKEANTHPLATPPGRFFEWGFLKLHPDFLQRSKE